MYKFFITALLLSFGCSSELTEVENNRGGVDLSMRDTGVDTTDDTSTKSDSGKDASSPDVSKDLAEDSSPILDAEPDLPAEDCDYEFSNGLLVIEAETLPLVEDWKAESVDAGFTGTGYLVWRGQTYLGDPSHGQMEIKIRVPEAGRYRFQWHSRVGTGNNATEHNDSWIKFSDAADYYGLKRNSDPESRRYPKPQCEDAQFIADTTASADVGEARCANGASRDGWMKVYCSGALDWRWSTFTSDSDGSEIFVEFDSPGVYSLGLAARTESHQIDRMVLSAASLSESDAQDLTRGETKCD